jgi:hypothetical protein
MTLPPVYRSVCEVLERWGHEDEAEALARAYVEQAARLAAAEKLAEAAEAVERWADSSFWGADAEKNRRAAFRGVRRKVRAALTESRATRGDKG